MFDNIGGKIQVLAKIICWIGIIACIIVGIIIIVNATQYRYTRTDEVFIGIVVIIGGSIFSWIGSFVLYGFGELVENSSLIRYELSKRNSSSNTLETSSVLQSESTSEPFWVCPHCTKHNPPTLQVCVCGTRKPIPANRDWVCPNCSTENKSYMGTCMKCGKSKPS